MSRGRITDEPHGPGGERGNFWERGGESRRTPPFLKGGGSGRGGEEGEGKKGPQILGKKGAPLTWKGREREEGRAEPPKRGKEFFLVF